MPSRTSRSIKPLALALAVGVTAVACGGSTDGASPSDDGVAAGGRLSAALNGSGATFPKPFYEEVIASYRQKEPGVTVNYAGGGSGQGRQNLQDGVVDFAGSDGLVKPEDVSKYEGGEFLYVPTVAAPITVSYNLSGVKELVLDAATIARIFQREISQWDDQAIQGLNPGVGLPGTPITVAHRSDGSGTTENFSKFLVAAAPAIWKLRSGATVEWPADSQAGNGNEGVAQIVKSTVGAIGYVDLSDARATGLQLASVRNRAGRAVKPTLEATSAALEGITVAEDLSYDPLDAEGERSYPISAPTWILVYKNQTDKTKGEALKSFLTFMLTEGQDLAGEIDYAKLPDELRQRAMAQVASISVPA